MLTIDSVPSDDEEYGEYYDEEEEEEKKEDGDAQLRKGPSAFCFEMMDGVDSDEEEEEKDDKFEME